MSVRRVLAAAAALLAVVYLKVFMPGVSEQILPTLREMTAQRQVVLYLPESAVSWLRWS